MKLLDGDVTDIAEASDGSAIYVVDAETANGNVYKSTDGGFSFVVLSSPAPVALTKVAVAPDRADVIAVTDGASVYVSSNGCATWTGLPALPPPWTGATITDLAVGPVRTGALLGREYVVALSDPLPVNTSRGDILIIGNAPNWASAAGSEITGSRDYVAVALTPGFAADWSIVALGTGVARGSTAVEVINSATCAVVSRALLNPGGATADFGLPSTGIARGAVSLPRDFNATVSSGRRGYAGIGSSAPQADNDAYRFQDTSATKLDSFGGGSVYSVSYSGTIAEGTLFVGRMDDAEIRYSANPEATIPVWKTTEKLLAPHINSKTVVLAASDFGAKSRVFAGTSGPQSGFSVSNDGGISFDQTALID